LHRVNKAKAPRGIVGSPVEELEHDRDAAFPDDIRYTFPDIPLSRLRQDLNRTGFSGRHGRFGRGCRAALPFVPFSWPAESRSEG